MYESRQAYCLFLFRASWLLVNRIVKSVVTADGMFNRNLRQFYRQFLLNIVEEYPNYCLLS